MHTLAAVPSAARTASDINQYIGCTRYTNLTTGAAPYMLCFARNSAGNYLSCQTSDPNLMRTAELINSSSYLYFFGSKIDSTSTVMFPGMEPIPTALRAPTPASGPKTWAISSL